MRLNRIYIFFLMSALILYPVDNTVAQLTVGDVDDNLNFDYFIDYIEKIQQSKNSKILPSLNFTDRVILKIVDNNGTGISNAFVTITPHGAKMPIVENYAGTNGIFYFFPKIDGAGNAKIFNITVSSPDKVWILANICLNLDNLSNDRTLKIVANVGDCYLPSKLDLMFVIDTTGSMSDELKYLTKEFKEIVKNITDGYPNVSIRFGLVLYRDIGDEYVVRNYSFTYSLDTMQNRLSQQKASGGGDYPEAMDQALAKAVNYKWREGNTARMLFLVADAPPHDGKLQKTMDEVIKARCKSIHIYSLAASGVADIAEYIMRCSSVLTHGRYMFLTDDSGIGNSHAEPHIKGYVVTYLDDLLIRVVGSELAGECIEPTEDEIIRTIGNVSNGIIVPSDINETEENSSGYGKGSGGSSGGGTGSGSGSGCGGGSDSGSDYYSEDSSEGGTGEDSERKPVEDEHSDEDIEEKAEIIDDTKEDIDSESLEKGTAETEVIDMTDAEDESSADLDENIRYEETTSMFDYYFEEDSSVEDFGEEVISPDSEKCDYIEETEADIPDYYFSNNGNNEDNANDIDTSKLIGDNTEDDSETPRLTIGVYMDDSDPSYESNPSNDNDYSNMWILIWGVISLYVIANVAVIISSIKRK